MWFLRLKVILTMDNLIKRSWTGCKKYAFCSTEESIDHLFISCPLVTHIWRLIHLFFSISPPTSVANLFGHWLNGVDKMTKSRICVIFSFLCAVWNCRNEVVFNKTRDAHFCWSFTALSTGFVSSPSFRRWSNGLLWILDVPVLWRSSKIFAAIMVENVLEDFNE